MLKQNSNMWFFVMNMNKDLSNQSLNYFQTYIFSKWSISFKVPIGPIDTNGNAIWSLLNANDLIGCAGDPQPIIMVLSRRWLPRKNNIVVLFWSGKILRNV